MQWPYLHITKATFPRLNGNHTFNLLSSILKFLQVIDTQVIAITAKMAEKSRYLVDIVEHQSINQITIAE